MCSLYSDMRIPFVYLKISLVQIKPLQLRSTNNLKKIFKKLRNLVKFVTNAFERKSNSSIQMVNVRIVLIYLFMTTSYHHCYNSFEFCEYMWHVEIRYDMIGFFLINTMHAFVLQCGFSNIFCHPVLPGETFKSLNCIQLYLYHLSSLRSHKPF